ncbi:MAG: type II secretion system protein GspM [Planctomycetota bacterium]|jgi:hypothetical protein
MQLTRREHWLAAGLGAFVVIWATYSFGVSPVRERMETLNRVIPDKQSELDLLRAKASEFAALRDGIEGIRAKIASQEETFQLMPFVDSLVRECGLMQNVVTMKPQTSQFGSDYLETIVEIEMEGLTQPQLFDFLLKLKSSEVLTTTRRLDIKKNLTKAGLLDSQIEISNLKLSQG